MDVPKIIKGGKHVDKRGQLEFFNSFDMSEIKRVYFTTHFDIQKVRAWQGHKIESRWFHCVKGRFSIKLVRIDNWENPSKSLEIIEFELSDHNQQVLYVPRGFVNGFKAKEAQSKLMIMSDYGFNEIEDDQVRFDQNYWVKW